MVLSAGDFFLDEIVGNSFRRELLVQIGADAHSRDSFDFCSGRAEAGAIQKVN